MAIEAMKGAGMSYAGSSSASDVKAESQAKVETASNAAASDDLMKKTIQIDTKETDKNGKDGNRDDSQAQQTISENSHLTIAYLSTMQYYFRPVRELPTGRGFADFVYIPKPEYKNDYPALIVELKWNQNAQTALQQIREKQYPDSILDYTGDVLLVGINYNKKTKSHDCVIEELEKNKRS